MNTPPRTSRPNKGKPPLKFDWTADGMCWSVESRQVVLSRQIGGTRVHLTPRVEIRKSGIRSAGKGVYLCHATPAGSILAEYSGKLIAIHEAYSLRDRVRPKTCPSVTPFIVLLLIYNSCFQRARQATSSVSAIRSGASIRRPR